MAPTDYDELAAGHYPRYRDRSAEELLTRADQLKRSTSQLADLSDEDSQRGLTRRGYTKAPWRDTRCDMISL